MEGSVFVVRKEEEDDKSWCTHQQHTSGDDGNLGDDFPLVFGFQHTEETDVEEDIGNEDDDNA
jgi:hypothetical protein